jgi:hypothetical protein
MMFYQTSSLTITMLQMCTLKCMVNIERQDEAGGRHTIGEKFQMRDRVA